MFQFSNWNVWGGVGTCRFCSIIQRNPSHEANHEEENKVERQKSSSSWNFSYLLESLDDMFLFSNWNVGGVAKVGSGRICCWQKGSAAKPVGRTGIGWKRDSIIKR